MGYSSKTTLLICALILGIGILGAGYSVGKAVYLIRKMNHTVTVKGLSEKDVKSDLGIWEINFREMGNDLIQIDQKIQNDQEVVVNFLKQQGFTANELDRTQLKIDDRLANLYNQTITNANQRYIVTSGIRVRSANVDLIMKTAQTIDKLLHQGVPLAFDVSSVSPNPSYYFTQLDVVRPTMMAEATKSARTLAEQFAKDSDTQLVGIQRANQGVFQIMSRDTSTLNADWNSNQNALGSINKRVRLVTTIEYQLRIRQQNLRD